MMAGCLGLGLKRAAKRPGLTTLLWGVHLGLGALATVAAWAWWRDNFSYAPAADTLLNAFNFAAYGDIGHYNRSSVAGLITASLVATAVASAVLGALAFGGTLEMLSSNDSRPLLHRFCRGAGHFFWRFLRLFLYTAIAAVPVVGLAAAALVPLLRPLDESAWEPGWLIALAIRIVIVGSVVIFFLLTLDYARIRVAAGDTRRAFHAWVGSLGFVLRRAPGTFGILIAFVVLYGILLAAYVGYCAVAPMATRTGILMLVAVQQGVMWLRAGVRVASVGAEVEYFERLKPAPAAPLPAVASTPEPGGPAAPTM